MNVHRYFVAPYRLESLALHRWFKYFPHPRTTNIDVEDLDTSQPFQREICIDVISLHVLEVFHVSPGDDETRESSGKRCEMIENRIGFDERYQSTVFIVNRRIGSAISRNPVNGTGSLGRRRRMGGLAYDTRCCNDDESLVGGVRRCI